MNKYNVVLKKSDYFKIDLFVIEDTLCMTKDMQLHFVAGHIYTHYKISFTSFFAI